MTCEHCSVPCKHCGIPTPMTGTKVCDHCWHAEQAVRQNPELVRKLLAERDAERLLQTPSRSELTFVLKQSPPYVEARDRSGNIRYVRDPQGNWADCWGNLTELVTVERGEDLERQYRNSRNSRNRGEVVECTMKYNPSAEAIFDEVERRGLAT